MKEQKKSLKPWIILLALPIPLLILTAFAQVAVRLALGSNSNSAVMMIVNILSLLMGMVSVILLMGIPVWIVFLVLAYEHNSKLEK
jgi:uncharacterized membrane protein HdeD (DUF308 family)